MSCMCKWPKNYQIRFVVTEAKSKTWGNIETEQFCRPVVIKERLSKDDLLSTEIIQTAMQNGWNSIWIPVAKELPESADYVLMSFENFSLPAIGRYEVNDEGDGAWYLGDDDGGDTCCSVGLFVNAWMPLPDPYESIVMEDE